MMIVEHPEHRRYVDQLRAAQGELRLLLEESFTMTHSERPRLNARYDELFHDLEICVQKTTLENAKMKYRVEAFTMRKQKVRVITDSDREIINKMVENEFKKYHQQLRSAFEETQEIRDKNTRLNNLKHSTKNSSELQTLYKVLVKRLHPDVHGETQDYQRYWDLLQQSYAEESLYKLRALYAILCIDDSVTHTNSDALRPTDESLKIAIERLRTRIDYERRKIERLKKEEPFSLSDKLFDATWIAQHRLVLTEQIHVQQRQYDRACEQLEALLGPSWGSFKNESVNDAPPDDILDDFMKNTYFSQRA